MSNNDSYTITITKKEREMSNFQEPCSMCGKQDALVPCPDCLIHGSIEMPNGDIITFAAYKLDDLDVEMRDSIIDYQRMSEEK